MTICEKEKCSGCAACRDICPKDCITMQEDEYGVIYPKVDDNKCIHCGLCKKTCPNLKPVERKKPEKCYAAYQTDTEVRKISASGGIAADLYKQFINKHSGIIYGVCSENDHVTFKEGSVIADIERFKGSQYTQADSVGVYQSIEKNLRQGKPVLFIGCPCQVAGCLSYMSNKKLSTDNLFTIDLLCHGVSPQKYLKEELKYLSEKYGWEEYSKVTFRTNKPGENYQFSVRYRKKGEKNYSEYHNPVLFSPYFCAFLFNTSLRESCFHCKYSSFERTGDLTIGDFIGLASQKKYPEYKYEKKNTSIIFVNSPKGKLLCEELDEKILMIERPIEEGYTSAPSMNGASEPSKYRRKFLKLYPKYGFTVACKKSQRMFTIESRIKQIIKKVIGYDKKR